MEPLVPTLVPGGFILLLLLLSGAHASGPYTDWSAVNALLHGLTLDLPDIPPTHLDQPFPIDFSATGLSCSGFGIGAFSLLTAENSPEDTTVRTTIRAAGLAVNCSGDVNVTLSGLAPGHGRLVVASNESALDFTVVLRAGRQTSLDNTAPVSLGIENCRAAVSLDELLVSGDATMQVLEQLIASTDAKSLIGDLVNPFLCKALANFSDTVVSPALRNVSKALSQIGARVRPSSPAAERRAWHEAEDKVRRDVGPVQASQFVS